MIKELEKPKIFTLDIFKDGKLVASLISEEEIVAKGSDLTGFEIEINGTPMLVSAEKIQISS